MTDPNATPPPEATLETVQTDLDDMTSQRDQLAQQLLEQSNQHLLDTALREAKPIDPETCETLLRARMDCSAPLDAQATRDALGALLDDKPFLKPAPAPPLAAPLPPMSAPAANPVASDQVRLDDTARRAAQSGNRRDLTAYLRLRRSLK
ncbi:MAG: hypothetical protein HN909_05765 [Phycisphaerales bacterium]|jgi:hypothetical protein|nr:hypothetical protein [Phycisphaerales bacterium]MBT7171260.1 hypothetical protein [Phycisphaerales bacterium]